MSEGQHLVKTDVLEVSECKNLVQIDALEVWECQNLVKINVLEVSECRNLVKNRCFGGIIVPKPRKKIDVWGQRFGVVNHENTKVNRMLTQH